MIYPLMWSPSQQAALQRRSQGTLHVVNTLAQPGGVSFAVRRPDHCSVGGCCGGKCFAGAIDRAAVELKPTALHYALRPGNRPNLPQSLAPSPSAHEFRLLLNGLAASALRRMILQLR